MKRQFRSLAPIVLLLTLAACGGVVLGMAVVSGTVVFNIVETRLPFGRCKAPCRLQVERITVGEVVDTYGGPHKFAAFVVPGNEKHQMVAVTLFYPKQGMTVLASKQDAVIDTVSRDFQVDQVSYWESRTLEGMLHEFAAANAPEYQQLSDWSADWTGFGPVTVH